MNLSGLTSPHHYRHPPLLNHLLNPFMQAGIFISCSATALSTVAKQEIQRERGKNQVIRALRGKLLSQKVKQVWVSQDSWRVPETHLLEALLQCNTYTQRQVPSGSVITMIEKETLPGDSEKQPPTVAIPTLPSDETSLPVYWAYRESPCLPTWTRIPHSVFVSQYIICGWR